MLIYVDNFNMLGDAFATLSLHRACPSTLGADRPACLKVHTPQQLIKRHPLATKQEGTSSFQS